MFDMLSFAASCARLWLPCLAAAALDCCIVGKPLEGACAPRRMPLLARLLPATAAALADGTLDCLRPTPLNVGFDGLAVMGGLLRKVLCGVEPVTVRAFDVVCC